MSKLKTKKPTVYHVAVFISIIFIALILLIYGLRLIWASDDTAKGTGSSTTTSTIAIVLDPIDSNEWDSSHTYDPDRASSEAAGTITAAGYTPHSLTYGRTGKEITVDRGKDVTIQLTPATHHKLSFFSISTITSSPSTSGRYGKDITGTISPSKGSNIENSFKKIEEKTFTSGFTTISFSSSFGYDGGSFTLHNVTDNLEIRAWYMDETFYVGTSAGTGGKITPSESVAYGKSKNIQITPDPGYVIKSVTVDGVDKGNMSSFYFSNITSTHQVTATFDPIIYTVTSSAGNNGRITASQQTTYGKSLSFDIAPNKGYAIEDVLVDGASQGAIPSYTFEDIQNDHTISASFKLLPPTISFTDATDIEQQYTTNDNNITITGEYFSGSDASFSALFDNSPIDVTADKANNTFSVKINTAGKSVSDTPYNVSVSVTNDSGTETCTAQIKIVNTKPILTVSPSSSLSLSKGAHLVISAAASDINVGQPLSIEYKIDSGEWTEAVTGTAGTELSQLITISTDSLDYGAHTFNIRAYDGIAYVYYNDDASDTDWDIIIPEPTITLSPVDDQPYTEDDNYVTVGGTYTSVVDFDIKASFDGSPAEVTIDADNNMFTVKINTKGKSISNNPYSVTAAIENVSGSDISSTEVKVINVAPVLTIADSSSSSVEKNEDFIINASASDVNVGQSLSIEYKIDNGEWIEAATGLAGTELKKTISIPTDTLSYGSHTFNVRAYDGIEYVYAKNNTEDQSWQVHIPEPTIFLTASVAPDQQYTTNRNSISFSGTYTSVVDSEISAKFDGAAVDVTVDDVNKTFSVEINTSSKDVSETPYVLEITISNDGGSASCEGAVKVINTKPTLTIPESLVTSLNKGDTLSIDVSVDDINVGQPLSIEYKIDNGEWIEAASGTAGQTLQATISIPTDTLSYGKHSFNIRAYDGLEYTYINPDGSNMDWSIPVPPPTITTDDDILSAQYTVKDNYITFSGTYTSAVNASLSVLFDGREENAEITFDSDAQTYTVKVNTAKKVISQTPYEISVSITNDGGSASCKKYINILNTKPTISIIEGSASVKKDSDFIINGELADINIGQAVSVEYCIDNKEWTLAETKDITSNDAVPFNITIPTTALAYGSHTINIRGFDGFEYSYINSDESAINWEIAIPAPTIEFDDNCINIQQQYTINSNIITLTGKYTSVVDAAIVASFDGVPVNVIVNENESTFSIDINTEEKPVSDDGYSLVVNITNVTDSSNCESIIKIVNTPPVIKLSDDMKLNVEKGSPFIIKTISYDCNPGQELTIEYKIDDGEWILATKQIAAAEDIAYNIEIDTNSLTYKSHLFNVRVTDGFSYSYLFDENDPSGIPSDMMWSIPIPPPSIIMDQPEKDKQQYTTKDNVIQFRGTYTSEGNAEISAEFDGSPVPISVDDSNKTFLVDVNTSKKAVKDTPYQLKVSITNESGTDSCVGSVSVTNTRPIVSIPDNQLLSVEKGKDLVIKTNVSDINYGQKITVEYQIDDGEWIFAYEESVSDVMITQDIIINTSDIDYRNHTFNIRAFDGIEYSYAFDDQSENQLTWSIPVPLPKVSLDNPNIPGQQYTVNDNLITITGAIDSLDPVSLDIRFNGKKIIADIDPVSATFTAQINTAGLAVSDTPYMFIIKTTNSSGTTETEIPVKVINTLPSYSIKVPSSTTNNMSMDLEFQAEDINCGQTIILEYKIDNGDWIKATDFITNGKKENHIINISLETLTKGAHNIQFRATDGFGYTFPEESSENDFFNFEIISQEAPVITVSHIPSQSFSSKKNVIKIAGNVSDPEGKRGTMTCNGIPVNIIWTSDTAGYFEMDYDMTGKTVGDIANLKFVYNEAQTEVSTEVVNDPPSIKVISFPEIISLKDSKADILCQVQDINDGQELLFYYSFDGTIWTKCNSCVATGNAESIPFNIPTNKFVNGLNNIYLMVTDKYNYAVAGGDTQTGILPDDILNNLTGSFNHDFGLSKDQGIYVKVISGLAPTLWIKNIQQEQNENDKILATLTIGNSDINQKMDIYYQIDNNWPEIVETITSTGTDTDISILLEPLPTGSHTLTFFAVDPQGAKSNANGNVLADETHKGNQVNILVIHKELASPYRNKPLSRNTADSSSNQTNSTLTYYLDGSPILSTNENLQNQPSNATEKTTQDQTSYSNEDSSKNTYERISTGIPYESKKVNVPIIGAIIILAVSGIPALTKKSK